MLTLFALCGQLEICTASVTPRLNPRKTSGNRNVKKPSYVSPAAVSGGETGPPAATAAVAAGHRPQSCLTHMYEQARIANSGLGYVKMI